MKVGLLSSIRAYNYGASLQAYALCTFINRKYSDNSISAEYIHYIRDYKQDVLPWFFRKIVYFMLRKDDYPSWTFNECFRAILMKPSYGENKSKKEFDKFFHITPTSSISFSKKTIKATENDYDIFMVGSDQVWNCGRVNLDTTRLLDFVSDDNKKASYASSLGMEFFPEKYKEAYKKYLSKFKHLSCREKSGAELISELTGKTCECSIDPVFLLSESEWLKLHTYDGFHVPDEDYILFYKLSKGKDFESAVDELSKKAGLKVVSISWDLAKNDRIGPIEFINLISKAKLVVTDSFHGTCFSVIFDRSFVTYIPDDDFFVSSSSRIFDILSTFGFQDRIIKSTDELRDFPKFEISDERHRKAKEIIKQEVNKSVDYFNEVFGIEQENG